jgi:hypothetical protein
MSKKIDALYYSTPRHGYFKVDGDDMRGLKISQCMSHYSFYNEDDDIFYLEEDCDASIFMKRCELDGVEVNVTDEDIDSDEEESIIRCHSSAGEGGDWGYFGELEQNTEGLEEFFSDYLNDDDEDDEEEDDE